MIITYLSFSLYNDHILDKYNNNNNNNYINYY